MPDNDSSTHITSVQNLGEAIRKRRKAAGLTQQDVADFCGVGKVFVVHLEQGKQTIQLGKVLNVLQGLGLELSVRPRGRQ
jgi:y4mF family transcriptional regulator